MKKIIPVITVFLVSWSCQLTEPKHPIVGDWRWVSSVGGIGGWTVKPKYNDERILRLTINGKFEVYTNNLLSFSADYRLSNTKRSTDGAKEVRILIDNPVNYRRDSLYNYPGLWGGKISALSKTGLTFCEDYCDDCYTHSFVRK